MRPVPFLIMPLEPQQLIENLLDALAAEAAHDFERTMETWDNHKSPVQIEKAAAKRVVYVADDIYFYLNFGTKVRRVMLVGEGQGRHGVTSVGKTRVRNLSSSAGQKRGLIISKKFEFPGIDAREFDLAIIERISTQVLPPLLGELADNLVESVITVTRT